MQVQGMAADFSWHQSGARYAELYASDARAPGMTFAPGVSRTAGGTQFAVTARDAERVELCLFEGKREIRQAMQRRDGIHVAVADVSPASAMAIAPMAPGRLNRDCCLISTKLLVGPYTRHGWTSRFQYDARLSLRGVDTAGVVLRPSCRLPVAVAAPPPPVFVPGGLIYELNVRGFNQKHPAIPTAIAGHNPGAGPSGDHRALQEARCERNRVDADRRLDRRTASAAAGLRNAWGYNPVVPMGDRPRLAPGGVESWKTPWWTCGAPESA